MSVNNGNETISWEIALQQANGKHNLAVDMMKMLIDSLPAHEAELETAYKEKDFETLHDSVHKLYGALCYTGMPKLKKIAKEFENSFQGKQKGQIDKLYKQLRDEIEEVKKAYAKLDLKRE